MSKTRRRRRSRGREPRQCPVAGKLGYPARKNAKDASGSLRHAVGHVLHTYRCSHCGYWHLTSQEVA